MVHALGRNSTMEARNIQSKIEDAARNEAKPIRWRKAYGLVLVAIAVLSCGCASYRGTATSAQPSVVAQEGHWTMVRNFPYVPQANQSDCGAAALAAVLRFWGHPATPQSIEAALGAEDNRLKAGDMEAYARSVGMRSYVFFGTMKDVVHELEQGRPVIVGLGKMVEEKKALSHYQVVVGWEPNKKQVLLLDPARGWQVDSLEGFGKEWAISKGVTMVAFPDTGAAAVAAAESLPKAAGLPSGTSPASLTDAQRYAAREATSPDAKKYRGGDYIVISASALAVVLLVVLILILI
jgi:predicted double-glycine peptidase